MHGGLQSSPEMVITQYDVFGLQPEGGGQFFEGGGAHVGCQLDVKGFADFGHCCLPANRVFQVFNVWFEDSPKMQSSIRMPDTIGINAQRNIIAECLVQGNDGICLLLRFKYACFEFDGFETEMLAHGLCLVNNSVGVERSCLTGMIPAFCMIVKTKCQFSTGTGRFIKQVSSKGNRIAHFATQKIHHRS